MKTLLFQMISTLLIVICMVSTFLYFVVKKKKISKTLNDKEDFFLKIGIGIILLIVLFKMFIPTILDIPHYLKNDFNVVSGYARDNANGSKQEIYVEFSYSYKGNKGDYVKVKYLPYTKYGILLEKKSID